MKSVDARGQHWKHEARTWSVTKTARSLLEEIYLPALGWEAHSNVCLNSDLVTLSHQLGRRQSQRTFEATNRGSGCRHWLRLTESVSSCPRRMWCQSSSTGRCLNRHSQGAHRLWTQEDVIDFPSDSFSAACRLFRGRVLVLVSFPAPINFY